jgi:soluble lytic murein transglycosylase-like protein
MLLGALTFAICLPLWGTKFVVLQSGFHLKVDNWEVRDGEVLLHREGGVMTLRASQVVDFVEEPDAPAPVAPAAPVETPKGKAPEPPADPRRVIAEMADQYGLPASFVASVARAESAYNPNAVSNKGAIGVMQLMPGTAKALGVDPNDVRQNIEGGTRLLRDLLLQYQNDPDQVRKALAAYNAGPAAVERHGGVPPYRETQQYVEKVLKTYQSSK